MKTILANIESKEELIFRLIQQKEMFYYTADATWVVYYDPTAYGNSIRRKDMSGDNEMVADMVLDSFKQFRIQKPHEWEDDLENGHILCFVTKGDNSPKTAWISKVFHFDGQGKKYMDTNAEYHLYAVPVTSSMLLRNNSDFEMQVLCCVTKQQFPQTTWIRGMTTIIDKNPVYEYVDNHNNIHAYAEPVTSSMLYNPPQQNQ